MAAKNGPRTLFSAWTATQHELVTSTTVTSILNSSKTHFATDDKRLGPKQLRVKSRLSPVALPSLPPKGSMLLLVRVRLTKRQATSKPDHLWPELWIKLARNAKLREKQKWSIEKPKLDNARRLRGICVIDSEDKEFKDIIRNARKKLETPMAPAMPCKTSDKGKHGATRGKSNVAQAISFERHDAHARCRRVLVLLQSDSGLCPSWLMSLPTS